MAYVVTRLCIDCLDMGCVEVCPVECIYELNAPPTDQRPNMLYIHPTECIDCGACEPECPWQAIYEQQEMPSALQADVELNVLCEEHPSEFRVAKCERDDRDQVQRRKLPTPQQVRDNQRRHAMLR